MPLNLTDSQIVNGLLQQEDAVINYLYKEIGPKVKQYIMSVGGSGEEANDIFQDGIVAAYVNIKSGKYQLSANTKFTTYLIQICKYKWYDMLKSAHKSKTGGEMVELPDDSNIVEAMEVSERYTILHSLIDTLGNQCKEILRRFYWEKESIEEISKALKMVAASVKNGKYRCMQKLKESALNNEHLR